MGDWEAEREYMRIQADIERANEDRIINVPALEKAIKEAKEAGGKIGEIEIVKDGKVIATLVIKEQVTA